MGQVQVSQGSEQVVTSGSFIITRQSPPVLINAGEQGRVVIDFDLDEPFRRRDGVMVKPAHDAPAVTPDNTPSNPKVTAIGANGWRAEYFITPTAEPPGALPDGTGRTAPLTFVFSFRVLAPAAEELHTQARPPFDWLGPPRPIIPAMTQPHVDLAQMSWEQREAHIRATSPFFAEPKRFARSHEAG